MYDEVKKMQVAVEEKERKICKKEVAELAEEFMGASDLFEIQEILRRIERDSVQKLSTPFARLIFSELNA